MESLLRAKNVLSDSRIIIDEMNAGRIDSKNLASIAAVTAMVCAHHTLSLQLAEPIELANGVIAELENDMDLDGLASIVARATDAMERLEKMERN